MARKEAKRLTERADAHRAHFDRIKAATLRAMQDHGVRVLETPTNKLRVQANGGKEPLEITDLVPAELTDLRIKIPEDLWQLVCQEISENAPLLERLCEEVPEVREPNGDRIRAALKQQVPCSECAANAIDADHAANPGCLRCEGRGTIPNTVPGAKLLPRGFHLRVE